MGGGGDGLAVDARSEGARRRRLNVNAAARSPSGGESTAATMLSSSPMPAAAAPTTTDATVGGSGPTTPTRAEMTNSKAVAWLTTTATPAHQQTTTSSAANQADQPAPAPAPLPRRPRSIYEGKEHLPFWDAPLLVAVAANLVWPAVLLLLTGWSMMVVLFFRLERWVWATLLRRPSGAEYEGEDDAPVDVGLYWFGYGNHCEKHDAVPHKYFDPSKPSVIYVHGFSRRTTARNFRETFNWAHNDEAYGLDINAADAWLDAGWNIGIFYWNQLADEEMPQDTESKIWTSNGRTGMRYRTICPKKGTPAFYTPKDPAPSISQQLADVLAGVFRGSSAGYRLVGHSLGTQLVVHASTLLMQRQAKEQEEGQHVERQPRIVLPARIALLDVFGTLGIKAYLSGWPIMAVVQRELLALRARGVVLEQYQSSLIGRRGLWFRHLTAFIQLDPAHIPWWRLKSRHIAAIYIYFLSFGHAVQGPRLKKADLRRHQSAQIEVVRRPSAAAAAVADDVGTLNIDLADLLAASASGGSGGLGLGLEGSNSGGGVAKEEGGEDVALRSLSSSSLGGSGGGKGTGSNGALAGKLPFRVTITRIISRRRRSQLSASALDSSLSSSASGHGGRAGSRNSKRLASFSEEAVSSSITTTTTVVEEQGPKEGGGTIVTTEMSTTITSTTLCCTQPHSPQQQQQQPAAPALCHQHFAPFKVNKNHFRWLLRPTKVGEKYYREVVVGEMPLMARATDEEMRGLMECEYVYKQHNGHLFLRVSRAW